MKTKFLIPALALPLCFVACEKKDANSEAAKQAAKDIKYAAEKSSDLAKDVV